MRKKLLLALIPVLTMVGPPLALSAYQWWSQGGAAKWAALPLALGQKSSPAELPGPSTDPPAPVDAPRIPETVSQGPGGLPPSGLPSPSLCLEGQASFDLGEVLRFDATPGWIMARWPRVSAGLAEIQLQGYRVPLVTGTGEDDLAGALTYYFSPRQQVQKITFQGTTGDSRKIIQFLVSRYRFGRRLTNDPRLFRYEVPQPGRPVTSFLEIRPAQVVKASDAYHRFDVLFHIERPEE